MLVPHHSDLFSMTMLDITKQWLRGVNAMGVNMVNHSAASYGSESGRVMVSYGSGARPCTVCHFALGVGDERSCVTVGAPRSAQPADGFAPLTGEPDIV